MPEQPPSKVSVAPGVQTSLHAIAEILRDPRPLTREIRDVLADRVSARDRSAQSFYPFA